MNRRPASVTAALAAMTAFAAFLLTPPLAAQEPEIERRLSVRAGVAHTDNLHRASREAEPESVAFGTVGVDLGAARENRRLRMHIDGTLDYYNYDSDTLRNDTAGWLDAGLDVRIAPEVFSWGFGNQLGHYRSDPFEAAGPGNRERVNIFSTGPSISAPLGERNLLNVEAAYSERRWQETSRLDGDTRLANIALLREVSPTQRVGLTVGGRRVEFDDPEIQRYEVGDAFISYLRLLPSGSAQLDVGANQLRMGDDRESGLYFSAAWTRALTARSTLSVSGSRRFEDAGGSFGAADPFVDLDPLSVGDTPLSVDPFTRTRLGLTYTLTRPRAIFRFSGDGFRERFSEEAPLDRDGWRGTAGMDYRFRPALTGGLELSYGREEFELLSDVASERAIRVNLARRMGRAWDVRLTHEHNQRSRELGPGYRERRYFLSAAWAPVR